MVLLPQESVLNLQSLKKTVQTPGTSLSRLDSEMSEILKSSQLENDREKWSRYHQVLQRYLNLKEVGEETDKKRKKKNEQMDNAVDSASVAEKPKDATEEREGEVKPRGDSFVVENVPAKFRDNASNLVKSLRLDGRVRWNPNGAISIDIMSVNGANFIDLVNYAMRSRKVGAPKGIDQFARALQAADIPKEFIGNPKFRRDLENEIVSPERQYSHPRQNQHRGEFGSKKSLTKTTTKTLRQPSLGVVLRKPSEKN